MKGSVVEKYSQDYAHEVSDKDKDSTGSWATGHAFSMLERNLTVFFPCPKNLNKSEFRKQWTRFLGQGTFVRAECVGCGVVVASSRCRPDYSCRGSTTGLRYTGHGS